MVASAEVRGRAGTRAMILDGRAVAAKIRAEVAAEVAALQARCGVKPTLAVVLVGNDPASQVYVRNKRRACQEVGIEARDLVFPEGLTESALLALVRELNEAPDVHGILVQLPIPGGIDESRVLDAVDPAKDVDGFHPENLGRLLAGQPRVIPGTPAGIMAILDALWHPASRTAGHGGRAVAHRGQARGPAPPRAGCHRHDGPQQDARTRRDHAPG